MLQLLQDHPLHAQKNNFARQNVVILGLQTDLTCFSPALRRGGGTALTKYSSELFSTGRLRTVLKQIPKVCWKDF